MILEMVLVEVTEKRFMGKLYDRLNEATGGLVLEKDQKWTRKRTQQIYTMYSWTTVKQHTQGSSLTSLLEQRCETSGNP